MLKKILIALGLILVLCIGAFAALAIFASTELKVEREVTINRPKEEVFAYAKMLKNQNDWGPWFKKEPTMKQEFRGTDGEVGFVAYWKGESQETGEGEQEIKRVVEAERLETELRFKQPFESNADSYITTETVGDNQTKVKWGFNAKMPRPMNVLMVFIDTDAAIGKDFQEGLDSMKTILEK